MRAVNVFCTFLCRCFARVQRETSRNFLVTRFIYGEKLSTCSHSLFFSLPLIQFYLALVAASICHFLTAATKFSCCSSNKKVSFVFFLLQISVALFLVEIHWPFAYFLFFSVFLLLLYIPNHLRSKLITLDNTDTETIFAFRFRIY